LLGAAALWDLPAAPAPAKETQRARATGKDYQIWYYAAGAMQVVASAVLATPGAVPRFVPPQVAIEQSNL